jgi:hypothetical protein
MAQSVSLRGARRCPELGVERTCRSNAPTSHFDPERTKQPSGGRSSVFAFGKNSRGFTEVVWGGCGTVSQPAPWIGNWSRAKFVGKILKVLGIDVDVSFRRRVNSSARPKLERTRDKGGPESEELRSFEIVFVARHHRDRAG